MNQEKFSYLIFHFSFVIAGSNNNSTV